MQFKEIPLTPVNKTFGEIMSNDKSYIVPNFQRDYSWEIEQITELWQDIERMRSEKIQHFMGYLVLQSQDSKKFEIVDGQQRITTITLIIIAVLARLKKIIASGHETKKNEVRREEIHKRYLGVLNLTTLRTAPKLILNRTNSKHFKAIISYPYGIPTKRGITATSNRKINKAFEFFENVIKGYTSEALAQLVESIGAGLLFTTIAVGDDLDAYLVFETLNARGLHLAIPDLLKNYLLSILSSDKEKITDADIEEFEQIWAGILDQLGEANFTSFLRSYEGMSTRLRPTKELYRVLRNKLSRDKQDKVVPYVCHLENYATIYAALQDPGDGFWSEHSPVYKQCIEDLRTLDVFNIKTPLSLMMASYTNFTPTQFVKIVKWLAVISIRYNIIGERMPNLQEKIYNDISMYITSNKPQGIQGVKSRLLDKVYPRDEKFVADFSLKTMPSRQSNTKAKYLLLQIEKYLSGGDELPVNLTVEHILPAKPNDAWREYFGLENYNEAIGRLGNMTLLSRSKNMAQESFAEKKETLRKSPCKINNKIAAYDAWDIDTLNKHQKWLAAQAKAVWQIR